MKVRGRGGQNSPRRTPPRSGGCARWTREGSRRCEDRGRCSRYRSNSGTRNKSAKEEGKAREGKGGRRKPPLWRGRARGGRRERPTRWQLARRGYLQSSACNVESMVGLWSSVTCTQNLRFELESHLFGGKKKKYALSRYVGRSLIYNDTWMLN